jgi:hypothetical protein
MNADFKFAAGDNVIFHPRFSTAGRGRFTIVMRMPVENDGRVRYRIRAEAGTAERVVDEYELSVE